MENVEFPETFYEQRLRDSVRCAIADAGGAADLSPDDRVSLDIFF